MDLKKLPALVLGLCLALSLAACGGSPAVDNSKTPGSESPSSGESESPSQTPAEPLPEYVNEYTQAVAGVDGDEVMFTVDGMDVTAECYLYWLGDYCYQLDMQSQMAYELPLDFDQVAEDGITYAEHLKDDARKMATF